MSDRIPFIYILVRGAAWVLLRLGNRLEVIGRDHLPASGPVILACNHVSYVDPPALGCGLSRQVWYMAKSELFTIPVLGPLIRALGAFPVDRSRGDVGAIKAAGAVLAEGRVLGIFPEGTRNTDGTVRAGLGTALLAARTGATVVPAYISGSRHAARLAKMTVIYGEPFPLQLDRKARRPDLAKWTDELMKRIYTLERDHEDTRS